MCRLETDETPVKLRSLKDGVSLPWVFCTPGAPPRGPPTFSSPSPHSGPQGRTRPGQHLGALDEYRVDPVKVTDETLRAPSPHPPGGGGFVDPTLVLRKTQDVPTGTRGVRTTPPRTPRHLHSSSCTGGQYSWGPGIRGGRGTDRDPPPLWGPVLWGGTEKEDVVS